MKNYRLRIYREKRDKIDELRENLKQHHNSARLGRDICIVRNEAHQVRLLLVAFIESQKWPKDMQPMIEELNALLVEYPKVSTEDTSDKQQMITRIDKTIACTRKYYQFWSEKTTAEGRLASWVKSNFSHALDQHFRRHAHQEWIIEYDPKEKALHVFFGGLGDPLGPGHGHYKFRYRDRRLIFGRAPAKKQKESGEIDH